MITSKDLINIGFKESMCCQNHQYGKERCVNCVGTNSYYINFDGRPKAICIISGVNGRIDNDGNFCFVGSDKSKIKISSIEDLIKYLKLDHENKGKVATDLICTQVQREKEQGQAIYMSVLFEIESILDKVKYPTFYLQEKEISKIEVLLHKVRKLNNIYHASNR